MEEICSSNPPVVTGICDPNKFQAQHHRNKFRCHGKSKLIKQVLAFTQQRIISHFEYLIYEYPVLHILQRPCFS